MKHYIEFNVFCYISFLNFMNPAYLIRQSIRSLLPVNIFVVDIIGRFVFVFVSVAIVFIVLILPIVTILFLTVLIVSGLLLLVLIV